MAAKKRSSSKQVTITIDIDTLLKLADAVDALSEFAVALTTSADDPEVRTKLKKKKAKKRAPKRR